MTTNEFSNLLQRVEGKTIDFKAEGYDFSVEGKRCAFVKDILAMANTPRTEPSYIVLGVKKFPDNTYDLCGVSQHEDEAILQSKIADIVVAVPDFDYTIIQYDGKSFGLITIPSQRGGPFVLSKDLLEGKSKLRENHIFFRRGSKNETARRPEELREIGAFFAGLEIAEGDSGISNSWDRFLAAVHDFEKGRQYALISSPIDQGLATGNLAAIGRAPWSFVCDFDPESDLEGLLSETKGQIEGHRKHHVVVWKDRPILNPARATYWFFARGLQGREESLAKGSWKDWWKQYGNELGEQWRRFGDATDPTPITCVVLWYGDTPVSFLDSTLQMAQASVNTIEFVVLSDQADNIRETVEKYEATLVSFPLHQFCSGLRALLVSLSAIGERAEHKIPSSSGAPIVLADSDRNWLAEELEIVHLGIGRDNQFGDESSYDFLRGAEISWRELALHVDVDRDKTAKIKRAIENNLKNKPAIRVNLYHAPGAGGSTVARRILLDLHGAFPCAILERCEPKLTAERLSRIVSMTNLPVLLLVDGARVVKEQVDDLFEILRSRQVAVVLFQVLRRFKSQQESERVFYLSSQLTAEEAFIFSKKLADAEPHRRQGLQNMLADHQKHRWTPFHFGLEAFDRDFRGITPYVEARLAGLSAQQQQLMGFLSIAHHYAQRSIRAQAFAATLGIDKTRVVNLANYLTSESLELLIETENGFWRTSHDLIAEEILQQIFLPQSVDRRNWRHHLSHWAKQFAQLCRGDELYYGEEMLELARRTFIYRDNSDILGTERSGTNVYAQLIEDIPFKEGRLEVLKEIADLFQDEAHFHAHLGRFYANEMGDFGKAVECNDRAISLQGDDHVLHHMKGMTLRKQIYGLISQTNGAEPDSQQTSKLSEIMPLFESASLSFSEARRLNPEDEHAFISEAQMIVRVLDYAGREAGGAIKYARSAKASPLLRESLDHVEDLLEYVRRNHEGEGPNSYEEDCRARLDALYGHYHEALQTWDLLLQRSDAYLPPLRRQIVWTYLARRGRAWDALEPKEVERIIDLLEKNLQEEPRNDRNLRLWVQAVRRSRLAPSLSAVIERVAIWRATSGALDASYYLYVFNVLQSFEGSIVAREDARRYLDECSQMARIRRNRTRSYEWLGKASGLKALVHHSELGEWTPGVDFWENTGPLKRVRGRISRIDGPQKGEIELQNGLRAFFVPGRSGHHKDHSENLPVEFYLGFSYDGMRAWEVKAL